MKLLKCCLPLFVASRLAAQNIDKWSNPDAWSRLPNNDWRKTEEEKRSKWRPIPMPNDTSGTAPRKLPTERFAFNMSNYTPFVLRRITVLAQVLPSNSYWAELPYTLTKVMPNESTPVTTNLTTSVNHKYNIQLDFVLPADKDKEYAHTLTALFKGQDLSHISSYALFFKDGVVQAAILPK